MDVLAGVWGPFFSFLGALPGLRRHWCAGFVLTWALSAYFCLEELLMLMGGSHIVCFYNAETHSTSSWPRGTRIPLPPPWVQACVGRVGGVPIGDRCSGGRGYDG